MKAEFLTVEEIIQEILDKYASLEAAPEKSRRYYGTLVDSTGVVGCLIKTPYNKEFWNATEENPIVCESNELREED